MSTVAVRKKKRIKPSERNTAFDYINIAVLTLFCLLLVIPF